VFRKRAEIDAGNAGNLIKGTGTLSVAGQRGVVGNGLRSQGGQRALVQAPAPLRKSGTTGQTGRRRDKLRSFQHAPEGTGPIDLMLRLSPQPVPDRN
jgi:hypothetical protein